MKTSATRSLLRVLILGASLPAWAATPTEGTIVGQVRDLESSLPLPGILVAVSGPEGEIAARTDAHGHYTLRSLPLGAYTLRFQRDKVSLERAAIVSVDKVVRVNVALPSRIESTEVLESAQSAPMVDLGSARVGATLGRDFIENIPSQGRDVASLIQKSPGAYADPVGLSLAGGTGADNAYYLEGLNITALKDGLLGTNLRSFFLEEAEVMGSGFGVEYGRALGGVVNMALRSGTNEWRGSAFSWIEPGKLAVKPRMIRSDATVFAGRVESDYTTEFGAEVGGPLIKNRLFLWVGYAPQVGKSHFLRSAERFLDSDGDGVLDRAPDGSPLTSPLTSLRVEGSSTTHNYAGKLTYRLAEDHAIHFSWVGIDKEDRYLRGANSDVTGGLSHETTGRHDLIARVQSAFLDRRLRLDATVGWHHERYRKRAGNSQADLSNEVDWISSSNLGEIDPAYAATCAVEPNTGFNPCPILGYFGGGYGSYSDIKAHRWAGQLKSTFIFAAAGIHEVKAGVDYELNSYDDQRWFSGPDGQRGVVMVDPLGASVITYYRLPTGRSVSDYADPGALLAPPLYQDAIRAKTQSHNMGAFLQEGYSPWTDLTVNLGLRWEAQRLTDYEGRTALSITDSFAPRLAAIYDPKGEGRAKLYTQYGQYYESIPMDLTNRAFGGEGILVTAFDPATCNVTTGWRSCTSAESFPVSRERLYVQPNIQGSFNHEVVLGGQYQLLGDLMLGAQLVVRTLGRVIEDTGGSWASGNTATVLANPGTAHGTSLVELDQRAAEAAALAARDDATAEMKSEAVRLAGLADAARMPKPKRTYKGIQFTIAKRVADHWFFSGSYTYSRTQGNYTGLYAADSGQLNPNLSTQYDLVELMQNRDGPLPNDRPHVLRADGYCKVVLGTHTLTSGLGFEGRSGVPITPLGGDLFLGSREVFIHPRGSAGRTPFVTQLDMHFAYRTRLSAQFQIEAFVDIFNVMDRRTPLTMDAEYTTDNVAPAAPGTPLSQVPALEDVGKPLVGTDGNPVYATKNPNYRRATSYQAPITGRLGIRLVF